MIDAQGKIHALNVASLLHSKKILPAAQYVSDLVKVPVKLSDKDDCASCWPILQHYLHAVIEGGGMVEAAQMLWSPTQYNPNPESSRAVWQLFEEADTGLIMGAAKMSKSFSMGVRLFLEWIRDPEYTSVRVLGPSEDHLEENLFSHLVSLHQGATIPMPGKVGERFIGLDRRNQISSIRGVVVPKGSNRKAGRLQGGHRRPRPTPHSLFGPLSRMFIFLDEIENIPGGIWKDIDNVLSESEENKIGFKIFGAYNPTDASDEVAKRAQPPFGWENLDEEKHFRWKSIRGWEVLRLDGERCENVVQGKVIYPGLQTREGLARIAQNAGGRDAPGYRTMGRGLYPSVGLEATVIPPGLLAKFRGEYIWYHDPQPVGATDIALEGDDDAVQTFGDWGARQRHQVPAVSGVPKRQDRYVQGRSWPDHAQVGPAGKTADNPSQGRDGRHEGEDS